MNVVFACAYTLVRGSFGAKRFQGHLLLCCDRRWCVWWSARSWYHRTPRKGWTRRLELDLCESATFIPTRHLTVYQILEGIITFIVAVWAYFQIHDFPSTAKFLSQPERDEVARRLDEDRSSLADEYSFAYVKDALTDWKIWVHMVTTFGIYTALYSISLFLPTIIKNMGYKDNKAQLMTVPPYVVACVFTISGGFAADKFKQRGVFMIGFCLLAMMGMVMLIASRNIHVQYAGTFFAASGIYANVPGGVAWNSNNIGGSTKR